MVRFYQTSRMKIAKLIDFFIHPGHFKSPNALRRARLFVRACLLTSLFSNSYIWLSSLFSFDRGIYLMVFNVLGFLILPFFAKTKTPISWLGNLYVLIGASAVFILTYYSGGMWSAIYPWIAFIPILALLVVNKLSGYIWGGISLSAMLIFGVLAYQEVELPIEYNPDMKTIWYITVLPGLLLIILLIGFVFESIQSKALSELQNKNELLKIQKETIAAQSSKLEQLIDDKDQIIRILAHDLNNPLSNITSLVNMMREQQDSDHQQKFIGMIEQSSTNAQDLIKKVIEMDASNQKNLNISLETLNVNDAVSKVIELMQGFASKKNIRLILENNSSNHSILADKTYFSLIFENLISNAIKFSDKGKNVIIAIAKKQSNIQIKVVDQGQGIHPNEEAQLFKKFSKISTKPTAGESSTGLGLSLVKRYVELMNGKVWYDGKDNIGATFITEFPLAND